MVSAQFLYYENVRVFNPTHKPKPESIQEALNAVPLFSNIPIYEIGQLNTSWKLYIDDTDELNQSDEDALDFWINNAQKYDNLSKIAITCLQSMISSAEVERSFSCHSNMESNKQQCNMNKQ